jgi:predicted ATP-grasp superfamily ATP-dependent carboligase
MTSQNTALIVANTTDIAVNTENTLTNELSIDNNRIRLIANQTSISSNQSAISNNSTNVATLFSDVNSNTIFCTKGLSTHEFEESHAMQSVPNRTFKQTNLIISTAVTRGSK